MERPFGVRPQKNGFRWEPTPHGVRLELEKASLVAAEWLVQAQLSKEAPGVLLSRCTRRPLPQANSAIDLALSPAAFDRKHIGLNL